MVCMDGVELWWLLGLRIGNEQCMLFLELHKVACFLLWNVNSELDGEFHEKVLYLEEERLE